MKLFTVSFPRILRLAPALLLSVLSVGRAQTTLSLSSGSGAAGNTVTLALAFSDAGNNQVVGLQWAFAYPAASVTSVAVTPTAALTAASKTISCAAGSGKYACVATGLTGALIPNGQIASVQLKLSASATGASVISTGGLAASAVGNPVTVLAGSGAVTVTAPITVASLTCDPSAMNSPSSATCRVALSAAAPAAGAVVTLLSSNKSLTTPASVTIAAGAVSNSFTATAAAVLADQTAQLTASYNSSYQAATVSLVAPATVSSLLCNPASLTVGATATCTVTLSKPAPGGGVMVSLGSNNACLPVPASLPVLTGSSANFTIKAGAVSALQSVTVTAALNGGAIIAVLTVTPSRFRPASASPGAAARLGEPAGLDTPIDGPAISAGGIVNAASFVSGAPPGGSLARGSIFSIYGSGLGPGASLASDSDPAPTALGGVDVKIRRGSEQFAAGLLLVSSGQINAILPPEAPEGAAQVIVAYNGKVSSPASVVIAAGSPGVFHRQIAGHSVAIALNLESSGEASWNLPTAPARPGQIVALSLTGLGAPQNAENRGDYLISVGGVAAEQAYVGRPPGLKGVDSLYFRVPEGIAFGCYVPVAVTAWGITANPAAISVTADGSPCR